MKKTTLALAGMLGAATSAQAGEFSFSFEWGDIPLCTTGRPNIVPNPAFSITGLPRGTTEVAFQLVDLDVPTYPHGGGTVAVAGDGVIAPGAFTYKSPCPPGAVHTYEWRATARGGGKVLGKARARRDYPE